MLTLVGRVGELELQSQFVVYKVFLPEDYSNLGLTEAPNDSLLPWFHWLIAALLGQEAYKWRQM